MAGTSSDREAELNRIRQSESNTYDAGRSDSASKYKPGFTKERRARDPNNTSAGTQGPNGR
jgi:hypothetical protein